MDDQGLQTTSLCSENPAITKSLFILISPMRNGSHGRILYGMTYVRVKPSTRQRAKMLKMSVMCALYNSVPSNDASGYGAILVKPFSILLPALAVVGTNLSSSTANLLDASSSRPTSPQHGATSTKSCRPAHRPHSLMSLRWKISRWPYERYTRRERVCGLPCAYEEFLLSAQ